MIDLGQSIDIRGVTPGRRRLLGFVGPAAMVSAGYIDPGNWATDLDGGSRFGFQLLWVLLAANLIAILLQSLAARLGIVTSKDLAQACRIYYSRPVAISLWLLCEIAIVACDLAEVLGSAIALNLLFGIPLVWGAVITGVDVLLVIFLQNFGIRKLEAVVVTLILTVGVCLGIECYLAGPSWSGIAKGFIPRLDGSNLYVAIGIIGATVMPHNLYLHSSLVQTRQIDSSRRAKREAIHYNFIDTALSLNIAFVLNAAILVLSSTTFFAHGVAVDDLRNATELLTPLLGTSAASLAFAIGLLAAGQSSTITGTLAGQIVMDGFVHLRVKPVLRRIITRGLAIIPAVLVLVYVGDRGVMQLLVLSQVVLSIQLPFAMVPLLRFTNDQRIMREFANPPWVRIVAWLAVVVITALNAWLVANVLEQPDVKTMPAVLVVGGVIGSLIVGLLIWISCVPVRQRQ
ncbi:Nramp family divalent metal transporter [Burkholderia anthina]|uniref:Nramp family divalent metal transporter n=1 Tax=Burkholderia anthina TaxID=179879 RepID=UPI001589C65F|nr:Nramp family divalent metal transporter [Burkholderia anthina]